MSFGCHSVSHSMEEDMIESGDLLHTQQVVQSNWVHLLKYFSTILRYLY